MVLKHLLKESRSGTRILMLLHKDIDNLIILIYRPPKIWVTGLYCTGDSVIRIGETIRADEIRSARHLLLKVRVEFQRWAACTREIVY